VTDPTYAERGDIITVEDRDLGPVRMQGAVPYMVGRAGQVWRTGPRLGEDNERVLRDYLDFTDKRIAELYASGVLVRDSTI